MEEISTPERATLRIRVRFSGGHLLEINEAMMVKENSLIWLDYCYHCQDEQNRLIFRYDSTPHFPKLKQEQEKIAVILSTVDRAIEQTKAIITKQQRITDLMQDLLTGQIPVTPLLKDQGGTHP